MTDSERFSATMHYQQPDRSPICDFSFWDETLEVWRGQGLPAAVTRNNATDYFGMDVYAGDAGVEVLLCPAFEEKVLEERGDRRLIQQADGVRVLRHTFMSSIPHPEHHLLTDRASWQQHYLPRLDPAVPRRLPDDWPRRVVRRSAPDRDYPVALSGGSLFGRLRNRMGLEAVSYLVYDDPALFEEMVETVADCIIGTLRRALAGGVRFDGCAMWEDMCFNGGPLLSPAHFQRFLSPHYRRITDLLHAHGVDVIWVDCDGDISSLVPLWLEAGVNCMFPFEVGVWGADPLAYRRCYGRQLLMMGGVDKRILKRSPQEISRGVSRLAPLVEDGGYVGFCDHRVPPDVPLQNYRFYLQQVRSVWGKGVNLKPQDRYPRADSVQRV